MIARDHNRSSFVAGALSGLALSALIFWSISPHGKVQATTPLPRMLEPLQPGAAILPEILSSPPFRPHAADDPIDMVAPLTRDALTAFPFGKITVLRPDAPRRHA